MVKRSCKGNSIIGYLKAQIDGMYPYTWNEIFAVGIKLGATFSILQLQKIGQELKREKRLVPAEVKHPTAVQVSIDDAHSADLQVLEEKIKSAFNLARLKSGFLFEFILYIVLSNVQKQAVLVGATEETDKAAEIDGPEMVKRLVQILLLNRKQDKDLIENIKSALIGWEV